MTDAVKGEYILGKHSIVGDPRRKWEDRVFADQIMRKGDPLTVGIVADGVGSADFGSRGAQLALDTVVNSLEMSVGDDIPAILEAAIEAANDRVYRDNQEHVGDGLSTLVVTIVFRGRAFVGNVGDSRAYWIPSDGKLLCLTRDHSYFNIYGGDPTSDEAGVVVNAIGKKAKVQVDIGFYLKGDNLEQAYKLGILGLPLQHGDAILLCSDGLIKNAPNGDPYVKDVEIVNALKTEHLPDHAAIKMVSTAEGRRPDDNVSAVTIQKLPVANKGFPYFKPGRPTTLPMKWLIAIGMVCLFALVFLVYLANILSIFSRTEVIPTDISELPVQATSTEAILATPLNAVVRTTITAMRVVWIEVGTDSTVKLSEIIKNGQQVSNLSPGGVKLVAEGPDIDVQTSGTLYLIGQSSATILFSEKITPELGRGAIYIQPSGLKGGEIHFGITSTFATVTQGRMILELKGADIWLYCFEGDCEWHQDTMTTPVFTGSKMVYHPGTDTLDFGIFMTDEEKRRWNRKCNSCVSDIISGPTSKP